jgi:hypothetical protein
MITINIVHKLKYILSDVIMLVYFFTIIGVLFTILRLGSPSAQIHLAFRH